MQLHRRKSADELRELSLPFLLVNEAEHGLLIGLILGVDALPAEAFAVCLRDGNDVVGVALRLDDRTIVSRVDDAGALEVLANAAAADTRMAMVAGAPATVAAIRAHSRRDVGFTMDQMIYAAGAMGPAARPVDGRRRLAEPRDRELLIDAHLELNAALGASQTRDAAGVAMDRVIARAVLHVWETAAGDVVSCAGTTGETVRGIRLNYVYTPAQHRGHGYASALVRDLTRSLLHAGRSFVFLHADRANPTATALYARLGFEHVADFTMIRYASSA